MDTTIEKSADGRIRKTSAKALKAQGLKYCPQCAKALPLHAFGTNQGESDGKSYLCIQCTRTANRDAYRKHADRRSAQRKDLKRALVARLGGVCVRCGYSEFLAGLDFHHVDVAEKDALLAGMLQRGTQGLPAIIQEADKCALLCRNCHNAYHAGEWDAEWQPRPAGAGYTIKESEPTA